MKNLKIRTYNVESGMFGATVVSPQPETTITIPGGALQLASKLIPSKAKQALLDEGIDLAELVQLAEQPSMQGTLVEIEQPAKHERIMIALE
ncbi:MAG: hypothetical protein AAF708_20375 [Deinococcota bacterium]